MRPLHNFSFIQFLQQTQFLPFLTLRFRKALSVFLKILRQHWLYVKKISCHLITVIKIDKFWQTHQYYIFVAHHS